MAATREMLKEFNNRVNVTKIISEDGKVSHLTGSVPYASEKHNCGAEFIDTYENATKHVFFFLDEDYFELRKYYLCQKLHGKTPEELAEMKHSLVFFESWNPNKGEWVPCVGLNEGGHTHADSAVKA